MRPRNLHSWNLQKRNKTYIYTKPVHKCSWRFTPNSKNWMEKVYLSMGKWLKTTQWGGHEREYELSTDTHKWYKSTGNCADGNKIYIP